MNDLRICKIKVEEKKVPTVEVGYVRMLGNDDEDPDKYALKTADVPRESFYDALQFLVPYVLFMYGTQDTWDKGAIQITEVNFRYKFDWFGASVKAKFKHDLADVPDPNSSANSVLALPLQIPLRYFSPHEDDLCDPATVVLFKKVQDEALAFVRGSRATTQLSILEESLNASYDDALKQAIALGDRFGFQVKEVAGVS